MVISLLHSRTDTVPRIVDTDFGGLEALLGTSRSLGLTRAQYGRLTRLQQGQRKDGASWIPGELVGPRSDENMRSLCALVLDFDALQRRDLERLWVVLDGFRGLGHTSASHTDEAPKWRVVLPLLRPVAAHNWRERWLASVAWLELKGRLAPDVAAKNPSRLYYLPTNLADVLPQWRRLDGRPFDVNEAPPISRPKPRPPPAIRWESDDIERQARAYLKKMGPAIEGVHGDDKTFRAACLVVRDFGLSEARALELLREWNATCEPQWSDEELQRKLTHALRYGTSPVGAKRSAFRQGGIDAAAVRAFIGSKT